jgi:hypothetical protein
MKSIEIPTKTEKDWRYRALEILPGVLSYSLLALPVILSQVNARLTAYFIIAYLLMWFVKAVGINFRALQGNRIMNQHKKLHWEALNEDLEVLKARVKDAPKWHQANIERVSAWDRARIKPSEVIHAVIIANYNESRDVLEPTIQSVLNSHYNAKKIILILAYEERGSPAIANQARQLILDYQSDFLHAEAIEHPKDIEGEVIGKGGNITYAGRKLQQYLEEWKIEPNKVLVTTLDSDNRPDKKYFGALTYTFCATEEPKHASYQPIPMFLNNIWDAPAPMRVIATGNSFWMVVQSLRPHMLRNFSAHAQPMDSLIETDFWSVRTIVEDGHQFWRSYFRFDGKYEVYPIYVPIYQDAVLAEGYVRTLKAQFVQLRRWAWGASDIPYVFWHGYLQKNDIPKKDVTAKFLRLLEGHINWATAPLILLLGAFIPLLFNPQDYVANQLPYIASRLQQVAMFGILITMFLSLRSLPPKPARYRRHRSVFMVLQWIYLPITSITYSSFSALYSQTRLMIGKYLDKFDVTEKAVKK